MPPQGEQPIARQVRLSWCLFASGLSKSKWEVPAFVDHFWRFALAGLGGIEAEPSLPASNLALPRNGSFVGFGQAGILLRNTDDVKIEDVRAISTGVLGGILTGNNAIVKDCIVTHNNKSYGFGIWVGESSVVTGNIANNTAGIYTTQGRSTFIGNTANNNQLGIWLQGNELSSIGG